MSVKIGTLDTHTSFVGEGVFSTGTTLMFCNGVENTTLAKAKDCAEFVSNAFQGKRVEIFHNTTKLKDLADPKIGEKEEELSELFKQAIQAQIGSQRAAGLDDRDIRIVIFVHSHGAKLLKQAVPMLPEEDKPLLNIFSFGGVQMLPRDMSAVVENYVHTGDTGSFFGTVATDDENYESHLALKNAERIYDGAQRGLTTEEVIFGVSRDDLYRKLYPPSANEAAQYDLIFRQKDLQALCENAFFLKRYSFYAQLTNMYLIGFIPGTPFEKPEFAPLRSPESFGDVLANLSAIVGNVAKGVTTLGKHGLDNHEFSSYADTVAWVALRYLNQGEVQDAN
jgi:hypothetical protein